MKRSFIDQYLAFEPQPLDFEFFRALVHGEEDQIRAAVDAGVDLENIAYGGALNVAAWRGLSKEICMFLIHRGASLTSVDERFGRTPLHGFAKRG